MDLFTSAYMLLFVWGIISFMNKGEPNFAGGRTVQVSNGLCGF